jgi:hypothetical protein
MMPRRPENQSTNCTCPPACLSLRASSYTPPRTRTRTRTDAAAGAHTRLSLRGSSYTRRRRRPHSMHNDDMRRERRRMRWRRWRRRSEEEDAQEEEGEKATSRQAEQAAAAAAGEAGEKAGGHLEGDFLGAELVDDEREGEDVQRSPDQTQRQRPHRQRYRVIITKCNRCRAVECKLVAILSVFDTDFHSPSHPRARCRRRGRFPRRKRAF